MITWVPADVFEASSDLSWIADEIDDLSITQDQRVHNFFDAKTWIYTQNYNLADLIGRFNGEKSL